MSQNLEHEIATTNKRRIYCALTKKNCCVDTAVLFSNNSYIYNAYITRYLSRWPQSGIGRCLSC
jgi:hypothetical protein